MTPKVERLRMKSLNTKPSVSIERALLVTDFYRENAGKYSPPVMRALNFMNLCEKQTIYIGDNELIVGERGPRPKAVSTFPELNCHSAEDLRVLDSRPMTSYSVDPADIEIYEKKVIPYWQGRTMRDRIFRVVPEEWKQAYASGMFTEFMEQRAAGHTTLGENIYHKGMLDFKEEIRKSLSKLNYINDPEAIDKEEELKAMLISCDAAIRFANRHADLALEMAEGEADPERKADLLKIYEVCRWVPANAPRNLWEALQMYWFVHLGTIMELNGWDAMNPGHVDQHMEPFYERGIVDGSLTREKALELFECFLIKFNNQPAPPKVGVTAQESGTYNDFTNINLGGLTRDGRSGVSEVSYLFLEAFDEIHLLQPQVNVQVSRVTEDNFLKKASEVIRKGYGYPSLFNADAVVAEQVRAGKSIEDARGGGCSGCIETGCFGKEAYILTGYLNVPKILELAINNGIDPITGDQIGLRTGEIGSFCSFEELYAAFEKQLEYIVDLKIKVNNIIEKMYGREVPATFLSVVVEDCIGNGKDYYNGGPRYNTNYIQCCGIGTITDSLSAIRKHVFEEGRWTLSELNGYLLSNFEGREDVRQFLFNHTPFFGNDDNYADSIMQRVFASLNRTIEGKPNTKGTQYYLNMLSTTCHIYFGKKLGASANGRFAGMPESDGTSPEHGADRNGPTAVVKSLGKMDQVKTGGTLLNQKFLPSILEGEEGIRKFMSLIRTYFRFNGHHMQFNVVSVDTLRDAQANPQDYRDLLVRVAGYSDYFVDLDKDHQEEIIARSEQREF